MKIKLNGRTISYDYAPQENKDHAFNTPVPQSDKECRSQAMCVDDPDSGAQKCLLPEHLTSLPNVRLYRLYFSDNIKAVCEGDVNCLVEESTHKITTPNTNGTSKPYYWRVDTVLSTGEVMEGRIWST